jgi:hypothetical protein
MNRKANNALNLPQKSRSGTKMNSNAFMVAMIMICVIAFNRLLMPLKIQIAIAISEIPIAIVNSLA